MIKFQFFLCIDQDFCKFFKKILIKLTKNLFKKCCLKAIKKREKISFKKLERNMSKILAGLSLLKI